MIKAFIADIDGTPAHYESYRVVGEGGTPILLVTGTVANSHGSFKSVTRATAGTSTPHIGIHISNVNSPGWTVSIAS